MLAIIAAVVAALGGAFLGHIGYLGGPVFTDFAPAAHAPPRDAAVVLLSGDLGTGTGMAHAIATRLAADGFPVVGVNSLTYFRVRRTPAEAEQLLERAIARAAAVGGTERIVLIGQSFGADLLHVGLARAPAAARVRVRFVGLVVPENSVDYRASPSHLLSGPPDAPALPTARTLDWVPVTCIQGERETVSLCPLLRGMPNVASVALPGGHTLRRDAAAVHRILLDGVEAALAAPAARTGA